MMNKNEIGKKLIIEYRTENGQAEIYEFGEDVLLIFLDETGREYFADKNYPIFGMGGCLVHVSYYPPQIETPWKYMKKKYTDSDQLNEEDTLNFYRIIIPYLQILDQRRDQALGLKTKIEKTLGYIPTNTVDE